MATTRVPVVALTGHLGAGKTTVLNHLLLAPGARIGVIVNDYGTINVDAGLLTGQVDVAASIAGGCVCCLPEGGGLDEALERLAHPRLRLDVIVVEASGVAEPVSLARMIHSSGVANVRSGGLVDVVDAGAYFDTVDTVAVPPARFAAASLVVINKTDQLPEEQREQAIARIRERIHARNPMAHVVVTTRGLIDPALVFDAAAEQHPAVGLIQEELPLAELARRDAAQSIGADAHQAHAAAVSVPAAGPVPAGPLIDLLEDPPEGVYRLKGTILVGTARAPRSYTVNLVGRHIHVAPRRGGHQDGLVAIGTHLDEQLVRARLQEALTPSGEQPDPPGLRRLARYARLSA
ncbi:CobW family GTP-binding protein [Citricoccus nitrophenolicus]|uniref:CobW family GTP-binding protein n=1 Tax=Citricoccus nitrophenolicus TaxID=863575 RepID=UPI0039B5F37C